MSVWGKVLGAGAGFALGGPLGALVGAAAGHYIAKLRANALSAEQDGAPFSVGHESQQERQVIFATALVALAAKLTKADGVVSREEIEKFKTIFNIPDSEIKAVGAIFDQAKTTADGFEPYAEQVGQLFQSTPAVLENLIGSLFEIAKSDGWVHDAEFQYIEKVAQILGLDSKTFARVSEHYIHEDGDQDPYNVLGIASDVSESEIKARYRELAVKNHPDKLIANGMPDELIHKATEKLAVINSAYEKVCAQRNIK